MIDAWEPRSATSGTGLALTVQAEPLAANMLTQDLVRWLNRQCIDAARTSDISLAVYEALANCVDHAYRGADGQMTIEAGYGDAPGTVIVCVTDNGTWVDPESSEVDIARGRGLRLMRALCDELSVDGTDAGTRVCLRFRNCARVGAPA